ncbi:MAG: hypothetical protein KDC34_05180 [Saprospiraceae bacterium]|nr:hypothetical protein [Saprospiraceae bacterium]
MTAKTVLQIKFELIGWVLTIVVLLGILYPVWKEVPDYAFYTPNIIFILAFLTLSRYIFLLKHTFLGHLQILKVALMLLLIPFVFYLVHQLNIFQTTLDENGPAGIVGDLPFGRITKLANYVKSEMTFFGVGAIITCFLFFGRLMMSVWRYRNRGTI